MKIAFVPAQPHSLIYGGFESLMNSTFNILIECGIDVIKLDFWDKDVEYDVIHFWGIGAPTYENIIWAKKAKKKVIVTALFGDYDTLEKKVRFLISKYLNTTRFILKGLQSVDFLVVTSERHKYVAYKYLKFSQNRITVIPNTLLKSYYNASNEYENLKIVEFDNYVLFVGSICRRKNIINLIKAVNLTKFNLLIIGDFIIGDDQYKLEFENEIFANEKVKWINYLPRDSKEMISVYKNSLAFALPSYNEQQPTSAQEAALLGKPILLADKTYAYQSFYKNAKLVNPDSVRSIANGIKEIIENPESFIPPKDVFDCCKELNIANKYIEIYKSLDQNI